MAYNSGSCAASIVCTRRYAERMNDLIPYLIHTRCYGGVPFGVTARSKEKALEIIQKEGYEVDPKCDIREIVENISHDKIKESYIKERMGPIVCEGMWYPLTRL